MIDNPKITLSTDYRTLDIKSPLYRKGKVKIMDGRFTDEELDIAKVLICAVAGCLGYTVRRIGKYHTQRRWIYPYL